MIVFVGLLVLFSLFVVFSLHFDVSHCFVCVCVCCCFVCSVDRQSEIGDRKLESWTLGHIEDCICFLKCYMMFTIFLIFQQHIMLYYRFGMFLIRF